jgi:multiple sugar transport system substrate-binding protein
VDATWGSGFPLAIPAGASEPDGAWELTHFLTSFDEQLRLCLVAKTVCGRMDVMRDPRVAAAGPHYPTVAKALETTQGLRDHKEVPTYTTFVVTAFQEAWYGVKTPKQALDDAQAAVEQEQANYRALHKK